MKEIPLRFINFIDQNKRTLKVHNDIKKLTFLNKIKTVIDNEQSTKQRIKSIEKKKKEAINAKMNRWNEFRNRREIAIDKYIEKKKLQKAMR